MNTTIARKAPAKVNLILKVLGKRDDGFHEIASLMQKISLADDMYFTLEGKGILLQCRNRDLPDNEENIVWRAAKLFMEKTGRPDGVTIGLNKNIPIAAGLGGGSSNAATALIVLNELTGADLGREDLMEMGASLGSDVPFFMCPKAAWAFGRGERLQIVHDMPHLWFVICNPGVALSTADVYGGLKIGLTNGPIQYTIPRLHTMGQVAERLENDLEAVSERLCFQVVEIKEKMASLGALGVLMSGSGPTVFGLFSTRQEAEDAAHRMREVRNIPFVTCASSM